MSTKGQRRLGVPPTGPGGADEQMHCSARRARGYELIAQGFLELAAAERETNIADIYSTKPGHEPPEFIDRHREWVRLCPTIEGAYKPSKKARWWFIWRKDYEKHLETTAQPKPANDGEWSPLRAMHRAGYREGGAA